MYPYLISDFINKNTGLTGIRDEFECGEKQKLLKTLAGARIWLSVSLPRPTWQESQGVQASGFFQCRKLGVPQAQNLRKFLAFCRKHVDEGFAARRARRAREGPAQRHFALLLVELRLLVLR